MFFTINIDILIDDSINIFASINIKVSGLSLINDISTSDKSLFKSVLVTSDHPAFNYSFVNAYDINFELDNKDQYNEKLIESNIRDFMEFDFMRQVQFAFIKEN